MNNLKRKIPILMSTSIILGSWLTTLGCILFALFMIIVSALDVVSGLSKEFVLASSELELVQGRVIDTIETNAEVNDESVWVAVYEYTATDGYTYISDAFTTGYFLSINDTVTVEHSIEKPQYSLVPGTRNSLLGWWGLLILIFPGASLILIYFGISKALKNYQILKFGKITAGTLINKESTMVSINDETVYKFTFEFHDENKNRFETIEKTHLTEKLEGQLYENILYNVNNPEKSLLVDNIIGSPILNADGNVTSFKYKILIRAMIIPAICAYITYRTML